MNRIIFSLAMLLLTGCQADSHHYAGDKSPEVTYEFLHPVTMQQYMENATQVVADRFYDISTYSGRSCAMKLHQQHEKMPDKVVVTGGDPALCEATIAAINQTISRGVFPFKPKDYASEDILFAFKI